MGQLIHRFGMWVRGVNGVGPWLLIVPAVTVAIGAILVLELLSCALVAFPIAFVVHWLVPSLPFKPLFAALFVLIFFVDMLGKTLKKS